MTSLEKDCKDIKYSCEQSKMLSLAIRLNKMCAVRLSVGVEAAKVENVNQGRISHEKQKHISVSTSVLNKMAISLPNMLIKRCLF